MKKVKIDRQLVWKKYNCKCAYCGEDLSYKAMQVDHIISKLNFIGDIKMDFRIPIFLKHLTETDLNHYDNLNPSCRQCNFYKSSNSIEAFRLDMWSIHKRIMKPFISRLGAKYNIIQINKWDGVFYFERKI